MAPKILITDRFSPEGLRRLEERGFELDYAPEGAADDLFGRLSRAQALIVRSQTKVTKELLERAPSLLVVGRAGVGCDNIDIGACDRLGILVLNTPGASAVTTAERTIALTLALLHQIPLADRAIRAGRWDRRAFLATEAFEKVFGVLGYGNVGRVVADRAQALKMRVIVHDPAIAPEMPRNLGMEAVSFDEILARSDILTCHVSGDPKLRGLIGARELAHMKEGAWFINTSRGFVVDESALIRALESGRLRGAALDVFDEEPLPLESRLRSFDNVVLSPHLGASSAEAERRVALSIADQVTLFLSEGRASAWVGAPIHLRHDLAKRLLHEHLAG